MFHCRAVNFRAAREFLSLARGDNHFAESVGIGLENNIENSLV